jgi:hypothetical protein
MKYDYKPKAELVRQSASVDYLIMTNKINMQLYREQINIKQY